MLGNLGKIVTITALVTGMGVVQAATGDSQRHMPATTHQIQTLNLNSGTKSNPNYQFSRRGADYAAVLPVTRHQANVLNLQNVSSAMGQDAGTEHIS